MEKQTEQKTNEKIKVTDIDIIVTDRFPNFYEYEIKYKKTGENEYRTGFGSCNFETVNNWKENKFELVTEEQKEEEHGVTNEELLKHLKEIEKAQVGVLNGINSLFIIINSKSELLQLDDKQKGSLKLAMIATIRMTEDMMEISGMNKRIEKNRNDEIKKFEEFLKDFLGF